MLGAQLMLMIKLKAFPLPLLPMILRSLNLATLFFITWELFLSSPQKFSSLPILRFTIVPSSMSLNAITLKAEGRVLFDLQWFGSAVQRTFGEPGRNIVLVLFNLFLFRNKFKGQVEQSTGPQLDPKSITV